MNEITPSASPLPPQITSSGLALPPALLPLGENVEERETIPNTVTAIESILRKPRRVMYQLRQPGSGRLTFSMLLVTILCSLIYGVVVGTFSMGDQLWVAPVKIAGGLLLASLICLPSLYIFTCLSGSQARLTDIRRTFLMTLLKLAFRRETFMPMLALSFASGVCLILVSARILWTRNLHYGFLIWNLFLAWLPLLFALVACKNYRNRPGR